MRHNDAGDLRRLLTAALCLLLTAALLIRSGSSAKARGAADAAHRSAQDQAEQTETARPDEQTKEEGADAVDPASLAQTPADVIGLRERFSERFSPEQGEDAVLETFFVTDDATDVTGNTAIRNATLSLSPDFDALLKAGPTLTVEDAAAPTVLIYHTHTSESYALNSDGRYYPEQPTHTAEEDRNVLRIGDELCAVLEQRGVGVIHDRTVYDDEYEGAYARSRAAAQRYLKENPTLQITVDVHRDAFKEKGRHVKPTALIGGKKAAQIMIITGAEEDGIEFPHWEENLRFALHLQQTAQEKYTGLMKPVFFCPRRYNMDLTKNSVLLEIGTEVNTLEEAIYSARLMGDVLADCVKAAEKQ